MEIIGITIRGFTQKRARKIRSAIFDLFKNKPYVGQIGITIYASDQDNTNQDGITPFLEVSIPYGFRSKSEIRRMLQTLKIEIR